MARYSELVRERDEAVARMKEAERLSNKEVVEDLERQLLEERERNAALAGEVSRLKLRVMTATTSLDVLKGVMAQAIDDIDVTLALLEREDGEADAAAQTDDHGG